MQCSQGREIVLILLPSQLHCSTYLSWILQGTNLLHIHAIHVCVCYLSLRDGESPIYDRPDDGEEDDPYRYFDSIVAQLVYTAWLPGYFPGSASSKSIQACNSTVYTCTLKDIIMVFWIEENAKECCSSGSDKNTAIAQSQKLQHCTCTYYIDFLMHDIDCVSIVDLGKWDGIESHMWVL